MAETTKTYRAKDYGRSERWWVVLDTLYGHTVGLLSAGVARGAEQPTAGEWARIDAALAALGVTRHGGAGTEQHRYYRTPGGRAYQLALGWDGTLEAEGPYSTAGTQKWAVAGDTAALVEALAPLCPLEAVAHAD
jgi:hypothetical protein